MVWGLEPGIELGDIHLYEENASLIEAFS